MAETRTETSQRVRASQRDAVANGCCQRCRRPRGLNSTATLCRGCAAKRVEEEQQRQRRLVGKLLCVKCHGPKDRDGYYCYGCLAVRRVGLGRPGSPGKLTVSQVRIIRHLWPRGVTTIRLGAHLGVSSSTVHSAATSKSQQYESAGGRPDEADWREWPGGRAAGEALLAEAAQKAARS